MRRAGVVRRRPLLRTALVGGGAYLAGKSAAQRGAAGGGQAAPQEPAQAASQDPAPQDPASQDPASQDPASQVPGPRSGQAPADVSVFSQLDELVRMHDRGALTDDEFAAAKARLLG